jgi:hypothetical protein
MVRFEFRWWVWVVALLVVFMVWKGPATMEWFGGTVLHGFADVGDAILKGLGAVRAHQGS